MNVLSLYSGIGGIDLAARWADMTTVAFCEMNLFCRSVLRRHWPGVPILEKDTDVTTDVVRDRVDLIVGGPPCQPFSVAGRRDGVVDARHRWPEMARIAREFRPSYLLVENVPGFSVVAEQLVRADLDGIGYRTIRVDLPAAGVGAPHKRERIFVLAYTDRSLRLESESLARGGSAAIAGSDRRRMADAHRTGWGERRRTESNEAKFGSPKCGGEAGRGSVPAEPRMGRVADVISNRLDLARWPAALGRDPFGYEPPRVTDIRKHRRGRLRALGNAVAPLQVFPILAGIAALWRAEIAAAA
jgi:DNA (cytosine-5)-methyltransferase 1